MAARHLALAAVLLCAAVASSSALTCPPGQGVAKADLAGALIGALFGRKVAEQAPTCSPCARSEASLGGENAVCETCAPGLAAPNADHTACECMPGSYAAATASATSVQRTCVSCGSRAVSTVRNAAACHACPANAKATAEQKCGCEPGFVATGMGDHGVTGCRKCGVGEVSPGGLAIQCEACSEATPPLADASACGCRAGFRINSMEPLTCTKCESVLTYTPAVNRMFTCQQCAPFSYATADNTNCVCGGGYYAAKVSETGTALRCVACPEGTFKATASNEGVAACIACPQGTEPSGSKKQCVPARCPAGTQRMTADNGTTSCQLCGETEFNYRKGGSCKVCPDNTMPNPQRTKCDACAEGYLQTSQTGQDLACNACMVTFKWDAETKSCKADADDPSMVVEYKPGASPKKPDPKTKLRAIGGRR